MRTVLAGMVCVQLVSVYVVVSTMTTREKADLPDNEDILAHLPREAWLAAGLGPAPGQLPGLPGTLREPQADATLAAAQRRSPANAWEAMRPRAEDGSA